MAAAGALATSVGLAFATPGLKFEMQPLARGSVADRINVRADHVKVRTTRPVDVFAMRLTIDPGGHTGWHSHPGPVLVAVKQGTVISYEKDCVSRTYSAGQGFVDRGSGHAHVMRNVGADQAELLVTALLPVRAPLRTDEPAAGECF